MFLIRALIEYHKRVVKKEPRVDFTEGAGYYLSLYGNPIETYSRHMFDMKSGNKAYCKLLSYRTFGDPDDMIKESSWQILKYEGEKEISEMSFSEFCNFMKRKGWIP